MPVGSEASDRHFTYPIPQSNIDFLIIYAIMFTPQSSRQRSKSMRSIVTFILFLLVPFSSSAEEAYEDYGIIFDPAEPPADSYESVGRIYLGEIVDDDTGETLRGCIIELKRHDWPADGSIPLDETGQPFILLDDDMTFLSAQELHDAIDPHTCSFYEYEASDPLASLFLWYAS